MLHAAKVWKKTHQYLLSCSTWIGAISPTPILPTYYRSVPFCLLMHNVKKSVLLGKQYSSSLCGSQIYPLSFACHQGHSFSHGWVCGNLEETWLVGNFNLVLGFGTVEIFKQEQSDTEVNIAQLDTGPQPPKRAKKSVDKDKKIRELKSWFSQDQIS